MAKLKLNLENLRVDSFETASVRDGRTGTVRAHEATALRDSCGCAPPTDGCSIGCPVTESCPAWSNNCWTVIEY